MPFPERMGSTVHTVQGHTEVENDRDLAWASDSEFIPEPHLSYDLGGAERVGPDAFLWGWG